MCTTDTRISYSPFEKEEDDVDDDGVALLLVAGPVEGMGDVDVNRSVSKIRHVARGEWRLGNAQVKSHDS